MPYTSDAVLTLLIRAGWGDIPQEHIPAEVMTAAHAGNAIPTRPVRQVGSGMTAVPRQQLDKLCPDCLKLFKSCLRGARRCPACRIARKRDQRRVRLRKT